AGRVDMHADIELVGQAARAGQGLDRPCEKAREHRGELVDAGLQELDDAHRLVRLRLNFPANALEAASARFQVGDADDVRVANPQGEKTSGFVGELVSARSVVEIHDRLEAVQVQPRVAAVLKTGAARGALLE